MGIRLRMKPGWHTYWKNPGDSGLPTSVEWTLPSGFTTGPIEWPAPERMVSGAEVSYGYPGEVLLPVLVTPPVAIAASTMRIAGKVTWLECADVCLPGSATLDLTLPVTREAPAPGPETAAFTTARSHMPRGGEDWNLAAIAGPRAIALEFKPPTGIVPSRAYLFVDQPLVVDYAAGQPWGRMGDGFRLTASPAPNAPAPPTRLTGVLVVEDRRAKGTRIAIGLDLPVAGGDPAPFQPAAATSASSDWLGGLARTVVFAAIFVYLASFWTGSPGWPFRRASKPTHESPPRPGPTQEPEEPHRIEPRTNGGPPGVV